MSQVRCVLADYQRVSGCVDTHLNKVITTVRTWVRSCLWSVVQICVYLALSIPCTAINTGHVVYSYREDGLGCFPDSD